MRLPAIACLAALLADAAPAATRPQFVQGSLNVFRRFAPEQRAAMVRFYRDVLGLRALAPIQLTASQQMLLFRVGQTGQVKLSAELPPARAYHPGGIADATGIRLFALRYPAEAALVARFAAAGLPAPAFRDTGGTRAALMKDPAGFLIELVIDPAAPAAAPPGVEVGINVSDLARARAFYRDFAGLDELPPVRDRMLGVIRYPFRHGETTVSLWSAGGRGLPADTGSAGMQYVVANLDAVNTEALARHVTVETPLGGVPGFNVRTVWLNDPDGVTNYFYQLGGAGDAPPPPR